MKIAIITGGSRGLGKAMAISVAAHGQDVILTYQHNKQDAEAVVAQIEQSGRKAVALQLDVSDSTSFPAFRDAVKQALKQTWNRDTFNFLVNNAGIGIYAPLAEATEQQFDQLVNINLKGPLFLTQILLPLIEDGGRIINISSGLARFSGPGYGIYGALKGSIEVLTRYMATEFGSRHITANVVAPGPIATDFGGGAVRDNAAYNQALASRTALGRVGEAEDIGGVVASLLSDEMHWINGQRIEASGGINL
ncbi:short-chain dehydrogenase [Reticulibacter mediterranei]|uniref:Short-chain dehydrogenase n=1 Tax=Reticulibacter mediterranei TaxID=2778369 RepID=A0A8J3N496_9CHLR|nr:SDR family oxidoreductase [Reticulibacter mediterranei]GHO97972.1 short-chain dehydrogenase [Reticulibacter mediterranei]